MTIRRTSSRPLALATAAALAASLLAQAPAGALEPDWRQTITGTDGTGARVVAVETAPGGITYVLSDDLRREAAQLTALDTASGAVRWTIAEGLGFAGSGSSGLGVDEQTGAAVLSTSGTGPSQVRSVSPDGVVAWTRSAGRRVLHDDLVVDGETGTVCATGTAGEVSRGVLECWSREGRELVARRVVANGRRGVVQALGVDGESRRIYIAADLRGRSTPTRPTVLAFSLRGRLLWHRAVTPGRRSGALDLAVDSRRGRVHLLSRDADRARLTGFRADGRRTSSSPVGAIAGNRPRARFVDVLPGRGRVAVTAQRPSTGLTSVRLSAAGGRVIGTRVLDVCCELARPVVDPERDRLLVPTGARAGATRDEGAVLSVVDDRGELVLDEPFLPAGSRARLVGPAYDEATSTLVTALDAPTGDDAAPGTVLGLRLP